MKMSEIFHLPLELRKDLVHFSKSDTCYFKVESVKSRDEELQVTYCIHQAINNHDRLTEENAKLRELVEFAFNEGAEEGFHGGGYFSMSKSQELLNQLKDQNNGK